MPVPITYLFVPGDRPDRFDKATGTPADVVILDLEDAVVAASKTPAREQVAAYAARRPELLPRLAVRVNDAASAWFADDIAMVRAARLRTVVLPKAESARDIAAVRSGAGADVAVVPIIESARGVRDVDTVAEQPGVQRLAFGTLDYGVDLNLSGDERGIAYAASRMAIASRCAGLAAPVAGITAAIDDDARLAADLDFARAYGFGGKLCIHPRQLAAIDAAFRPSAAEIDWARRVVAASAGASGAFVVDGRMVDRPVVLKAQSILDRAAPSTAAR
jgi:citrate lyase subunit beta/citryl-CoA lyase